MSVLKSVYPNNLFAQIFVRCHRLLLSKAAKDKTLGTNQNIIYMYIHVNRAQLTRFIPTITPRPSSPPPACVHACNPKHTSYTAAITHIKELLHTIVFHNLSNIIQTRVGCKHIVTE